MKFNKIITSFFSIAAASLLVAACGSNEQTAVDEAGKIDLAQEMTFKIEAEEYQTAPAKNATRAAGETVQPQEIDLGNGLVAELTIEPDTLQPAPQTRATISDGHYRIYAVNSSNQRLTGPNESMAGNVSGGVFTPDANSSMRLAPGTYTFMCINDAVTDNGNSLTIKENAVNAMMGTTTVAITQPRQEITFTMRHMMARIRYQITSYTSVPTNTTIQFSTDADFFGAETFDIKGVKTSQDACAYDIHDVPLTATATVENSAIVKKYKSVTNYLYFPAGYDDAWIQVGELKGTLHGKTFNIPHPKFVGTGVVKRNHSYLINITIKSKDPLVLFQDGTVGYMGDKGTRTPIGLVIEQRTETTDGLAVALKDAARQSLSHVVTWYRENAPAQQFNSSVSTSLTDHLNDMNGYFWTYDPAGSLDGKSKATEAQAETESYGVFTGGKYVAFYMATRYDPGVGLTFSGGKRGKWFLPSLGQLVKMMKVLGNTNEVPDSFSPFGSITMPGGVANFDIDALTNAFMYAGGQILDSYWYWSSSEYDNTHVSGLSLDKSSELKYYIVLDSKFVYGSDVRSFIHF